ncbi:MAG: DUF86 domain-containing protein [Thermovirgaceae bacterium]|nr:DUF86 domain-containing protein [Thermovirgaceae bacterium]
MMQPKDYTRLKHMMEYAEEAKDLAIETTRDKLATDRKLELALTRLVEIIGEAAARVSTQTREKYPDIPWIEMIGLRNRLIHGYDAVDLDILWDILMEDLPPLIQRLKVLLDKS